MPFDSAAVFDRTRRRSTHPQTGTKLAAVLLVLAVLPVACVRTTEQAGDAGASNEATKWMKAEITYYDDPPELPPRRVIVTEPRCVAMLAEHFPDLGEPKQASEPSGWAALLAITFHRRDGETVRVKASTTTDDQGHAYWSEDGRGDYPLQQPQHLEARIRDLIKDRWQQPAKQAERFFRALRDSDVDYLNNNTRMTGFAGPARAWERALHQLRHEFDFDVWRIGHTAREGDLAIVEADLQLDRGGWTDGMFVILQREDRRWIVRELDDWGRDQTLGQRLQTFRQRGAEHSTNETAADRDDATASLGPVKRATLSYDHGPALLDLDTDRRFGPIAQGQPSDRPGLDVYVNWTTGDGHENILILTHQLRHARPVDNSVWGGADGGAVSKVLRPQSPRTAEPTTVLAHPDDTLPSTYIFQTQQGTRGILQVMQFNRAADAVRLRYRRLRSEFSVASFEATIRLERAAGNGPWRAAFEHALEQDLTFGDGKDRDAAVRAWRQLLDRHKLPADYRVFAHWRIGAMLSYNLDVDRGEQSKPEAAWRAFRAAKAVDPELVSVETLNATTAGSTLPATASEQGRRLAEGYRWLSTRTDDMLQRSAARINGAGLLIDRRYMRTGGQAKSPAAKHELLRNLVDRSTEGLEQRITDQLRYTDAPEANARLAEAAAPYANAKLAAQWRGMVGERAEEPSHPKPEAEDTTDQPSDPDPWAFHQGYDAVLQALYEGESRTTVAERFQKIAAMSEPADPGTGTMHTAWTQAHRDAQELAKLLRQMADEQQPADGGGTNDSHAQTRRIRRLVYELRDVAAKPMMTPGKADVIHDFLEDRDNAAVALRRLGKPAVPALLALLEDRRPTRAISTGFNGSHALRYQDIALQILEAIACRDFDDLPGRGAYLSNAKPALREKIRQRIRHWWDENRDRPETQWIREALRQHGLGAYTQRHACAQRLIELDAVAAETFLTQQVEAEPANPHLDRLIHHARDAQGEVEGETQARPTDLTLHLLGPGGRRLERPGVMRILPASIGYRPEVIQDGLYDVDDNGVVSIKNILPGVHRYVAYQPPSYRGTPIGVALPANGKIASRRLPPPDDGGHPDLDVKVRTEGEGDDTRLIITVTSNTNQPYTLRDTDLSLVSIGHRVFLSPSSQPIDRRVPPRGEGELTVRLDWSTYLHHGLWSKRAAARQIIGQWPSPSRDPETGRLMFHLRVKVGISHSLPIALPVEPANGA